MNGGLFVLVMDSAGSPTLLQWEPPQLPCRWRFERPRAVGVRGVRVHRIAQVKRS